MSGDEVRRGAMGVVDDEFGDPLTAEEVAQLSDGTRVIIIWSGGNGPHTYVIVADEDDPQRYAVTPRDVGNERMRYYNPIEFVGAQRYHTRVWRREIS